LVAAVPLALLHFRFCVLAAVRRKAAPYVRRFIELTFLVASNEAFFRAGVDEFAGHDISPFAA